MMGWLGMALLLSSYLVRDLRRLLAVQLVACVCLLVYAVQIGATPYIALNAIIALIVIVRLAR